LYWLADDQLHEICELPSGGDNSYPGFVDLGDDRGLLSFYSSHEGSGRGTAPCHIYLAELRLD
ncbi:MAG: exo-alpha-sialidase, partial [Candidatus Latescibacterota bacterium]|nr:exo-alpha-sialidase [Candidatus Latescibacterota bacterium]